MIYTIVGKIQTVVKYRNFEKICALILFGLLYVHAACSARCCHFIPKLRYTTCSNAGYCNRILTGYINRIEHFTLRLRHTVNLLIYYTGNYFVVCNAGDFHILTRVLKNAFSYSLPSRERFFPFF